MIVGSPINVWSLSDRTIQGQPRNLNDLYLHMKGSLEAGPISVRPAKQNTAVIPSISVTFDSVSLPAALLPSLLLFRLLKYRDEAMKVFHAHILDLPSPIFDVQPYGDSADLDTLWHFNWTSPDGHRLYH